MLLLIGNIVLVQKENLLINGVLEEVGTVYRVLNGAVTCKVGYLPKVITFSGYLDQLNGKYAVIEELYALSRNTYKVMVDTNMHGSLLHCRPSCWSTSLMNM